MTEDARIKYSFKEFSYWSNSLVARFIWTTYPELCTSLDMNLYKNWLRNCMLLCKPLFYSSWYFGFELDAKFFVIFLHKSYTYVVCVIICHNNMLAQLYFCYFIQGKSGPAYLFSHAMNIIVGQKEDRKLITGLYTIADIYCCNCGEVLGWKYLRSYDVRHKNKEGKFIIERARISKEY